MMLDWMIGLVGSFFSSGLAEYWLFPLMALYFLSVVPALIRFIFSWR